MFHLRGFSISASTILQLYINHPRWRVAVGLRLLAILFASSTITCDAIILLWKPIPKSTPWWNFHSLDKGIPFLPVRSQLKPMMDFSVAHMVAQCSFSILWGAGSIVKLLVTKNPIHPGADIGIDLFLSLLFAATFVLAALGPNNQWRFDGSYGLQTAAGKLELVGIIGLIILLYVTRSTVWSPLLIDNQYHTFCLLCLGL